MAHITRFTDIAPIRIANDSHHLVFTLQCPITGKKGSSVNIKYADNYGKYNKQINHHASNSLGKNWAWNQTVLYCIVIHVWVWHSTTPSTGLIATWFFTPSPPRRVISEWNKPLLLPQGKFWFTVYDTFRCLWSENFRKNKLNKLGKKKTRQVGRGPGSRCSIQSYMLTNVTPG